VGEDTGREGRAHFLSRRRRKISLNNNSPGGLVKVTVQYNFKFLFAVIRSGTLAMTSGSQMVISQ